MPLPQLDLTLPTDTIRVAPWPDPVIDRLGHDPRSSYAETFWLPVIGPSTFLLLRRLVAGLDEHPDGYDMALLDGAQALGLGTKGGRNAPFVRAIARSIQFKICGHDHQGTLTVRRRLAPLTRHQVSRLGPALRDEHEAWQRTEAERPTVEEVRRRARRLALSLVELGEDDEAIEHQLHRWRLHPAMAHEALRWARERATGGAVAAPSAPTPRPVPPPPNRSGQTFAPGDQVA
ncbi:MAG: hypothetical protein KF906_07670 [Actinobacteria bacterium]|nr:hypothetical protein [Actinomycetota bacterium]